MEPFLRTVAGLLLQDHGSQLADVVVVLPSQRAGLYLRKHLSQLAGGTLWSPQVLTLTGLSERISGLQVISTTDLFFEAYTVYQSIAEGEPAAFGEFLQWAPTAMQDMSEVDAHLIALDPFYRDLRNWEELDWSFNTLPLSQGQERMVRYWAMKGRLHRTLNERLLAKACGTAGLVERRAVAEVHRTVERTGWTKVWAAGLNALNPAEVAILRALKDQGILELAWDADRYYLNDPEQEAGSSMRSAIAELGPGRIPPVDLLATAERTVDVAGLPNAVAQVVLAAATLRDLAPEERSTTAVVLADEQLLMPLLDALPPDIGPVNVTMGMPLNALPVGGLLDAVAALHRGYRQGLGFRLDEVDRLLGHPLLAQGEDLPIVRRALNDLVKERRAQLGGEEILKALQGLSDRTHANVLFSGPAQDGTALGRCLLHALSWAKDSMQGDAFAQEQLFLAAQVQQRMNNLMERHGQHLDVNTYAEVHQRLLREERLGLFGEPLSGVQIMGMLETRALDMDRVIMLSAEEGTLPPSRTERSFIPFELRRAHGLPLRHRHDAVSAYHFLRGLQRSTRVLLAHSTAQGAMGQSRFILQLDHELAKHSRTRITHRSVQAPVPSRPAATVFVEKDDALLERISERLSKGISPSAFAMWLRCPLDFHFRSLMKLKDPEAATDIIAADLLGNALHGALEKGYEPLLGSTLNIASLNDVAARIPDLLRQELVALVGQKALLQGQPMLQHAMAEQAAVELVRQEAQRVADGSIVELLGTEVDVNVALPDALAAHGLEVNIVGRVDRIERRDGELLILDLKTGSVKEDMLRPRSLNADDLRPDKDQYALQLLIYAWADLVQHPEVDHVKAGLVPLQRASQASGQFLLVDGSSRITRVQLPLIEAMLHRLVERILDPTEPFTHRTESRYCTFCLT
jgi:hypothetical protein